VGLVGLYTADSLGNSLGLRNRPNKWTNITNVDEPRYVNLEDEAAPSDMRVADIYHNRPTVSFTDEYRRLPPGSTFPCSVAELPANVELNRFPHLLAYDHSRVKLEMTGDAESYINANYVPGFDRRRKAYIAAQSPFSERTICDFWLMVYQQRVSKV